MISDFRGGAAFLSNFFPIDVELDGEIYPSVEHAYQAAKTHDLEWREKIRHAANPQRAKRLGQRVPLRSEWEAVKIDVMRDLLRKKFCHPLLATMLKQTGQQELVEGNWWKDTFWGQCPLGNGQNWLGRLLMEVRSELAT